MMGFKAFRSALATIAGVEVTPMIRKKSSPFQVFAELIAYVRPRISKHLLTERFTTQPSAFFFRSNELLKNRKSVLG